MVAGLNLVPIADRNKETRKRTHPEEFVDDEDSSSSSSNDMEIDSCYNEDMDIDRDESGDEEDSIDYSFCDADYGYFDVYALQEQADSNLRPNESTNMIVSVKAVENGLKEFGCPKCHKFGHLLSKPVRYGIISEIEVTCTACNNYSMTMEAPEGEKRDFAEDDHLNNAQKEDKFFQYGIHYAAVVMCQKLGMGMRGLATVLAFFGIYYTVGVGGEKWRTIQDVVGEKEHTALKKTIAKNLELEMKLTIEKAEAAFSDWILEQDVFPDLETREDMRDRFYNLPHIAMYDAWMEKDHGGKAATPEQRLAFKKKLKEDYLVEIGVGGCMDQGWSKRRKSHLDQGTSKTSHNICIGYESKKIINTVVMSQKCKQCAVNKKRVRQGDEPKEHRCPLNYDPDLSAKSMEGNAAVRHVEEIYGMGVSGLVSKQVALTMICTDDDATTRANVKHSFADVVRLEHPEATAGLTDKQLETKKNKERFDWPETGTDKGKVPINIPAVHRCDGDRSHRVKNMAALLFAMSGQGSPSAKLWKPKDSQQMKKIMNRFFHDEENLKLPLEEFEIASMSIIYHYFDQHQYCAARWCGCKKIIDQATAEGWPNNKLKGELKKFKTDNKKQYRNDYDPTIDGKPAAVESDDESDNHDSSGDNKSDNHDKKKAPKKKELPKVQVMEGRGKKKTTVLKSIFGLVKEKLMPYLSGDMLKQIHHFVATQMNEAFNRTMTMVAPKDRMYGMTCSLEDRNCLVVMIHSEGIRDGLLNIYDELGLQMPYNLMYWAHREDEVAKNRRIRDASKKTKKARAERNYAGKCQSRKAEANSKKDKTDYSSGDYAFI